jgi:uncharacterized PurR-regulated membrane protein YhhQ (DUF165 family)
MEYKPAAIKALEGTLTYLNAFLILDLARARYKDQPGLAVIVTLVITIIILYFLHIYKEHTASGASNGATVIPPLPNNPAETFRLRRNIGSS